jgi:hypothetical protein
VEEMRNLDQVQQTTKKSLWLVDTAKVWIHIVNNEKQTSKGLKKIIDDT